MKKQSSYISSDTEWYLAEIVLASIVEGDDAKLIHNNLTLVRAASPHEAYEKALALGKRSERVYANTDGAKVNVTFRGLRNLHVIHDALKHGSKIFYEE